MVRKGDEAVCFIAFLLQKNGSHIIDTAPLKMINYLIIFAL